MDGNDGTRQVRMRQASHQPDLCLPMFDEMAKKSNDENLAKAVNHGAATAPRGERFVEQHIGHRLKGSRLVQGNRHRIRQGQGERIGVATGVNRCANVLGISCLVINPKIWRRATREEQKHR